MIERPKTHYAVLHGAHIGYQVFGQGPIDLVFVPQWFSNVEAVWDLPPLARFVEHLARFSRVLLFDKRGTGVSDALPASNSPFIENFNDDVHAVLDAAGFDRPSIVAGDSAGLMAIVFAASHPDRVSSLVLISSFANLAAGDDTIVQFHTNVIERVFSRSEGAAKYLAPSMSRDPALVEQLMRYLRLSASPNAMLSARRQLLGADISDVLGSVQTPTLVLHRTANRYVPIHHGRNLAANIPGARLIELAGDDHLVFAGDQDAILEEIAEFLTGQRPAGEVDRVLAAVLFTDIVASTERAAAIGDRQWRELLSAHETIARSVLDHHRGRLVQTTGDGILATFDGPGRAIRCAHGLIEAVRPLELRLRAGLHTGEIELLGDNVGGIAVHIAARVAALAEPDEVLVSGAVPPLVAGSGLSFDDRGEHLLKGVPGTWKLFSVST